MDTFLLNRDNGVNSMLTRSIISLCKAMVPYNSQISLNGVICVTIDNKDVLVIDVRETIENTTAVKSRKIVKSSPGKDDNRSKSVVRPRIKQAENNNTSRVAEQMPPAQVNVKQELVKQERSAMDCASGSTQSSANTSSSSLGHNYQDDSMNDYSDYNSQYFAPDDDAYSQEDSGHTLINDSGLSNESLHELDDSLTSVANSNEANGATNTIADRKRKLPAASSGAETSDGDNWEWPAFICSICGMSFKHRTHLTRHMKRHAGIAFKCDYCSKVFTRKDSLSNHMRNVCQKNPQSTAYNGPLPEVPTEGPLTEGPLTEGPTD